MPPKRSRLTGKILHSQSREIVANVLSFLRNESNQCREYLRITNNAGEEERIYIGDVQKRCSVATGISLRTIQNISKEQKEIERGEKTTFSTPKQKRKRSKPKRDMDEFDKGVVRRTVHRFIVEEKCVPTIRNLLQKLSEDIGFDGSRETLRRILRDLGFRWQKTKTNKRVMIEKHDVRLKRIEYLTAIQHYREQGRPIVYVDKSYVPTNHTATRAESDDSNSGHTVVDSKGPWLIIAHAWGEEGLVPHATLIWEAEQTSGDHRTNRSNYEKWLRKNLIPNLQPNTVLVMDNTTYYNYQINKTPTSNAKKSDMIEWLLRNRIPHAESMLKPQLYQLILIHKPRPRYTLDEVLSRHGHAALYLPPYHQDLNPVEMIRGKLKNWLNPKTLTYNLNSVKALCENKMAEISVADWLLFCERVKRMEEEYHEREQIIDRKVESIIANLGEVNSDSDWDSESDDDDDADRDIADLEDMDVL